MPAALCAASLVASSFARSRGIASSGRVRRITKVAIDCSSRLFATDMISTGRVHYGSGEIFKFDSLVSSFEISVGEWPLASDRLVVTSPSVLQALPRLWRGALPYRDHIRLRARSAGWH